LQDGTWRYQQRIGKNFPNASTKARPFSFVNTHDNVFSSVFLIEKLSDEGLPIENRNFKGSNGFTVTGTENGTVLCTL